MKGKTETAKRNVGEEGIGDAVEREKLVMWVTIERKQKQRVMQLRGSSNKRHADAVSFTGKHKNIAYMKLKGDERLEQHWTPRISNPTSLTMSLNYAKSLSLPCTLPYPRLSVTFQLYFIFHSLLNL